jgi:regulator of PEP synthase PpsR (kinase-PPPase family)
MEERFFGFSGDDGSRLGGGSGATSLLIAPARAHTTPPSLYLQTFLE